MITNLNLFNQLLQVVMFQLTQTLHIRQIHRTILLALWANVFVNVIRFALQDSHTSAVEPVLAFVTADIEL